MDLQWEKSTIPLKIVKDIQNQSKQRFYFKDKVYSCMIKHEGKQYVAMIDNVLGKSQPITFIALFNSQANLKVATILHYREPYGGAIQNKKWLSQFRNKKTIKDFQVGPSIQGISGATISVHSVTKGIFKLNLVAKLLLKQKPYDNDEKKP